MAVTKTLSNDILESIATQVGARLAPPLEGNTPFIDLETVVSGRPEIGETFEVWRLVPDAVEEIENGNLDITKLARPSGLWHHQLRNDTRAFGFARSKPLGPDPDNWSVRDVFTSELAARIQSAVSWVDERIPEDEVEVRLLSMPIHQVEAFWFVARDLGTESPWNNQLLIIHSREAIEDLGEQIDSTSFLASLPGRPRGMGLR